MNDFLQVAQCLKKVISVEYTKSYPDIRGDEVAKASKNGAVVFDTIDTVFSELSRRPGPGDGSASGGDKPYHLIEVDEDDRYLECSNSVRQSIKICDFLSQDKSTKFNTLESNRLKDAIKKREKICAEKAYESRYAKKELMKLLDNLETTMGLIQGYARQYLSATLIQLETQADIYDKEVNLGGKFIPAVKNYFKQMFTRVKADPNPGSIRGITDAYSALTRNGRINQAEVSKLNAQMINQSLHAFTDHMKTRREQLEELRALTPVLGKIVRMLDGEIPEPSAAGAKPAQGEGRMAFMTNKLRGMFRKK